MSWCFAEINNKLGEIYFDKVRRGNKLRTIFKGHCYVKKGEFELMTKEERQALDKDVSQYHFSYRNGKYKSKDQQNRKGVPPSHKCFRRR